MIAEPRVEVMNPSFRGLWRAGLWFFGCALRHKSIIQHEGRWTSSGRQLHRYACAKCQRTVVLVLNPQK